MKKEKRRDKQFEEGIYQHPNGVRLKVIDCAKCEGWGEGVTVMYYTNLPDYGRSWFGMDGLSLKNFMLEFVKVA